MSEPKGLFDAAIRVLSYASHPAIDAAIRVLEDWPKWKPLIEAAGRVDKKRYHTDFLIDILILEKERIAEKTIRDEEINGIIAQLRAADSLCEAAKEAMPYLIRNAHHAKLSKAIAEYEGKEKP